MVRPDGDSRRILDQQLSSILDIDDVEDVEEMLDMFVHMEPDEVRGTNYIFAASMDTEILTINVHFV